MNLSGDTMYKLILSFFSSIILNSPISFLSKRHGHLN